MKPYDCSLSILAGPSDTGFLADIVRHLSFAQNRTFVERILVIDTLSPSRNRAINGPPDLVEIANELLDEGVLDRVVELDARTPKRAMLDRKHFGKRVWWDRDFRRVPLRGWIAGLESSSAPYHVHYDCDILLHQSSNYCWVNEGIRLLELLPDMLTICPHPGPPASDGSIQQPGSYVVDERGFYRFETFSSRRFLTSRSRFENILPLSPVTVSRKRRMLGWFGLESPITNWELMVQAAMQRCGFFRAHLMDPGAWSLHAPDHGSRFRTLLPQVIQCVETGKFPLAQGGRYDLDLDAWVEYLQESSEQIFASPLMTDLTNPSL